jgi:hypothetical protein
MPPQVSIAKGSVGVAEDGTVGGIDVVVGAVGFVVDSFTPVVPFRGECPQPLTSLIANISRPIVKTCARRTFPGLVESPQQACPHDRREGDPLRPQRFSNYASRLASANPVAL